MVDVAAEMERRGLDAAAPDRRRHHLAPAHGGARSRPPTRTRPSTCSTRAASSTSSRGCSTRSGGRRLDDENRELQERLREQHAAQAAAAAAAARRGARQPRAARASTTCPAPPFTGTRRVEPDARRARPLHRLAVLLPRLGPEGPVPGDPRAARRRRELYDDALAELDEIVAGGALAAARRLRLLARAGRGRRHRPATGPASASCASRPTTATAARTAAWPTTSPPDERPRSARSPSRSTAPTSSRRASPREHDDYRAIIVKALADRLAEAFAEWLHQRARREWYAPERAARRPRSCARERFRGIRPAFGYPACPDHSEKGKLFDAARRAARSGSS